MIATGELAFDADGNVVAGPGHDGLDGEGWISFYASIARTLSKSMPRPSV